MAITCQRGGVKWEHTHPCQVGAHCVTQTEISHVVRVIATEQGDSHHCRKTDRAGSHWEGGVRGTRGSRAVGVLGRLLTCGGEGDGVAPTPTEGVDDHVTGRLIRDVCGDGLQSGSGVG